MKTAFHDIPESAYPFTIYAFRTDTGECVWKHTVKSGPTVLDIPALKKLHGVPVRVRIRFADGQIAEAEP